VSVPKHKLTDEQVAKIEEVLLPEVYEIEGQGRPKLAPLYDPGVKKRGSRVTFYRNPDAFEVFLYVVSVIVDGISFRKAAEYLTANTGRSITYEALRKAFNTIQEHYPEWKEHRAKGHGVRSARNINDPNYKDKKKQREAREKASTKRKLTELSRKYAEMQAKDLVKKGELPEEALKNPTKYQKEDGTMVSKVEAENIQAEQKQKVIFQPNEGPQTDFLASVEREVLYGGAAGGGKVVLEYQSVLTPTGYKNIKDIRVGDVICDPKGGVQTITHIHPWQDNAKWELEFDDGAIYDTVAGHLWQYKIAGARNWVVATTEEMLAHSTCVGRVPLIPTTDAVYFEAQEVSIDPYTLGVLLGDGCITNPYIAVSSHEEDQGHYTSLTQIEDGDWRISGQNMRIVGESRQALVNSLRDYNLLGTNSSTKFVPAEYKYNTIECRKHLLRGLMDTDGYRDAGRARAEFCTVSPALAEDVKFLAQSLGYRVSVYTKTGSYKNKDGAKQLCQKAYRIYITGENVDDIFSLQRKRGGVAGKQLSRRIVDIRKTTEVVRGRCITVSAPHSLYISDDFVVTHNSYALIADPVRYFTNKNFNGILLRRTNDELRELIWKTQEMYPEIFPGAKWSERKSQWTFPSGARLWMTYLDKEEDVLRYQGQAFTWIGFDELTQHPTPFAFNYMRSRLRTTDPTLPLCIRATTNPGGPGHGWVKKMFIDPSPANERFCATDLESGEELRYPKGHAKEGEPLFFRRFIPATLADNPYLSEDGVYEANLLSLPEQQRRQLLEGDWMVADGAAFPEFAVRQHVVEPFDIPDTWMKFRSCDFGYTTYSAVHWFAVDPAFETLYVYRELYVSKHTARELARKVLQLEQGEKIMYGVLDSSTWHKRGHTGPSIAEEMIAEGCRWRPADRTAGSRVAGKNRLHELLKVDPDLDMPSIKFFDTCRQIIADMQVIPSCPKGSDDIDVRYASDHAYDSVRYGIMSRPRSKSIFDFGDGMDRTTWNPKDPVFGY